MTKMARHFCSAANKYPECAGELLCMIAELGRLHKRRKEQEVGSQAHLQTLELHSGRAGWAPKATSNRHRFFTIFSKPKMARHFRSAANKYPECAGELTSIPSAQASCFA